MEEFTFKESVKQRPSKRGQGSLTNHLLCPMGISGREWGKGSTHHRNLKMTTSLFGERGWNAFYTLSLTSLHNAMQGSVVLRQGKADPLFCVYESKWPNLLYPSLRLALFSISRCSRFFFRTPPLERNDCRHLLHIFFFLRHFHFIKLQSMCFVCGEEGMTRSMVVPTTACIGGSSGLRISLCAPWKDMKSQLFKLSQAVDFFFLSFLGWGVCGEERFCNSVFLNKLQHFAEGSCVQVHMLEEPHIFFFLIRMLKSNFRHLTFLLTCFASRKTSWRWSLFQVMDSK